MRSHKALFVTLWTLQILLGLFFIAGSGAPKLVLPVESLPMPIPLNEWFVRFIGTCEVLGGFGLILPSITRIQTRLTPLAGLGLVLLTTCAIVYQLLGHQPGNATFALAMSLLCAFVAYGRFRLAPLHDSAQARSLQVAG